MGWKGKFFGALIGLLATRSLWGAVVGAIIGQLFDQGQGSMGRPRGQAQGAAAPIASVFFRTTFELMGHVAKSDGRVSEAEIGAARALMRELSLGDDDVNAAIACFRIGKAAGYDVDAGVWALRAACGSRHDLLRAFMELQLRAALAGNGISPPARAILSHAAERLGIPGLEFAHIEAMIRARQRTRSSSGARPGARERTLVDCYAELQIAPGSSDQDVIKAYRRQMSRNHPDKLVANGLPESMTQIAKEKTQRIQEAYETIRAARGMR